MDNNKRRKRRTKKDLENDIHNAAIKVISEVGFSGLTATKILQEAQADPPVFYNRYHDISDFIDKFVRLYDYWFNDSISVDLKKGNAVKNIEDIVVGLIDVLYSNDCMQKLIAWELNEDNFITRRTSQNRDNNSASLIEYFNEEFKNSSVNFNVVLGVIIGGIYYLIIHRKLATFNNIDYTKPESLEMLKDNTRLMLRKLFDDC